MSRKRDRSTVRIMVGPSLAAHEATAAKAAADKAQEAAEARAKKAEADKAKVEAKAERAKVEQERFTKARAKAAAEAKAKAQKAGQIAVAANGPQAVALVLATAAKTGVETWDGKKPVKAATPAKVAKAKAPKAKAEAKPKKGKRAKGPEPGTYEARCAAEGLIPFQFQPDLKLTLTRVRSIVTVKAGRSLRKREKVVPNPAAEHGKLRAAATEVFTPKAAGDWTYRIVPGVGAELNEAPSVALPAKDVLFDRTDFHRKDMADLDRQIERAHARHASDEALAKERDAKRPPRLPPEKPTAPEDTTVVDRAFDDRATRERERRARIAGEAGELKFDPMARGPRRGAPLIRV